MIGYGLTGTGRTAAITLDRRKRGAQNMVDAYSRTAADTVRILLVDSGNPANRRDSLYGLAAPLDLEGLIAPGDSGGGRAGRRRLIHPRVRREKRFRLQRHGGLHPHLGLQQLD
jgi:hypothetical protein